MQLRSTVISTSFGKNQRDIKFGKRLPSFRGSTVVKALYYKSEGRWFDPSWCQCIFIDIKYFRSHCGTGVDSASNRNEYQEYFLGGKVGRCVRLTTLPPSWADGLRNLGASNCWNPQGLFRAVMGLVYLYLYLWANFFDIPLKWPSWV